jgi:hypothetical protein
VLQRRHQTVRQKGYQDMRLDTVLQLMGHFRDMLPNPHEPERIMRPPTPCAPRQADS